MKNPIDIDTLMKNIRDELSAPETDGQVGPRDSSPGEGGHAVSGPTQRLSVDEIMRRVRIEVARRRGEAAPVADETPERQDLADFTDSVHDVEREDRATRAISDGNESRESHIDFGARVPAVPADRWQPVAPRLSKKADYVLSDLLHFSDTDFVETVVGALLHRVPAPAERLHYANVLRSGAMSKVEVLADIRWSTEGKAHGVHVDGLLAPYLLQRAQRWPVIGPVLAWALAFVRLPTLRQRINLMDAAQAQETHELGRRLNSLLQIVEIDAAQALETHELGRRLNSLLQIVESSLALIDARTRDVPELERTFSIHKMELTTLYRRVVAGAEQTVQLEEGLRASSDRLGTEVGSLGARLDGAIDALRAGLETGVQTLGDRLGTEVGSLGARLDGEIEQRTRVDGAIDALRAGLETGVQTLGDRLGTEVGSLGA
ncbi:MAG: DUF4214 domain-containing protein, partial [Luteimonas sp.]